MKRKSNRTSLFLLAIPFTVTAVNDEKPQRPNIIIILADDMGYSDLGCYGGEIETPSLDSLAAQGLRYRQFYNCARSCPTRASLLTGLYPHQAGMGWMAAANLQRPPYQGYLNNQCVTIAEVLKAAGYRTCMSGKWHVAGDRQNSGGIMDNWPNQRGFDRFYGITGGAANYFDMVYNNDNEKHHSPSESFYFTHAISDSAAAFVARHDYRQAPLFLYLAYTAPHWPLHALPEDVDKYRQKYRAGWDRLRDERFRRQQEIGLFGKSVQPAPRDEAIPSWEQLSSEEQAEFADRMAIYAAQIDAMDQGIGKIIRCLEERQQSDNTLILFLSDNGACAEHISGGQRKAVDGKADTFESYRINWANLSSVPYREYKHHTNEGGIATPLIVRYPKGIPPELNSTFVDRYGHVTDIMPTCVELAKASYPQEYNGNSITPMQGVSLVPNFSGQHVNRKYTFWEHEANIALRDGKWKLVSKTKEGDSFDEASIKLYDMEKDPTELSDLSARYPDRKKQMYETWKSWAESIGVFPMNTRVYGERQQAYRRDCINGEFDDNFGDWNLHCHPDAEVNFSIDEKNTISGRKTAKVEVGKAGKKPSDAFMKWTFNVKETSKVSIRFKARAKTQSTVIFRLEKIKDTQTKPINRTIYLTNKVSRQAYDDVHLSGNGNYQLVFYLGKTAGTVWIDDVQLIVTPEGQTFANPVGNGADPWVTRTDSCYYYCFAHDKGIGISKTKKLHEMGEPVQVWKAPDEGWNRTCIWAPELHYLRGKWYIYYAAGESGPPFIHQQTGVLESLSQDPMGGYIDRGVLFTGDSIDRRQDPAANRWAIDMNVFEWRGKLYAVWSGWEQRASTDKTQQNLYIAEMQTPWLISTPRTLLSRPDRTWETGGPLDLNEGPEVLVNGQHLFIIYSCGQSWLSTYKLAQLKLKTPDADPLNPDSWEKSGPVFTGNKHVYGVGHACFTASPDGKEHWIVYHSKISRKPGWERDIRLQPFTFRPDGSPDFGKALPAGTVQPVPSEQRLSF
jgi:arylsulfatase